MFGNLTGWHFLILLVIILLLFGAPKLPGLAKSLGESMRIFRKEVKTMKDEGAPVDAPNPAGPSAAAPDPTRAAEQSDGDKPAS